MSTTYVVLGLLGRKAANGQALFAALQRLRAPAVPPRTSFYRLLQTMRAENLIESAGAPDQVKAGGDGPVQPVPLRTTRKGEEVFGAWQGQIPETYEALRVRIAISRPDDLEALHRAVCLAESRCLEELHLLPTPPGFPAAAEDSWDEFCATLLGVLESSELSGRLKWLQDVRVLMESMLRQSARHHGTGNAP